MTIKECIDIVDNIKPNQYSIKDKVMWLSFLDETIINDVLKTHEGYDGRYDEFEGYSEDKLSVSLIVPSPYDRLYTAYLKMQIDKENGETPRYNNSMALYNTYMLEYRKHYNKTHMPLSHDARRGGVSVKVDVNLTEAEFEAIKRDVYNQLSNDVDEVISPDKLYDIVMSYVLNNTEMLKGKSPVKGVDYFTPEEIEDITAKAKGKDGKDGKDGITPTFSVAEVEGGHMVAIGVEDNTVNFTVKNGKDGKTVTKVSELENDVGYVVGKGAGYSIDTSSGFISISASDTLSLGGGDAAINFDNPRNPVPKNITVSGNLLVDDVLYDTSVTNKAYVDNAVGEKKVPTKVSELTNDIGYITAKDIPEVEVPTKLSQLEADSITGSVLSIGASALEMSGGSIHINKTYYGFYVDGNRIQSVGTPEDSADATNKGYVDGLIGDIDTALDSILALENALIENALIGGDA